MQGAHAGPAVHGFTRSGEALGWLRGHATDVCLLDIDMPDMDGLALANKVRERRPDACIIYGYSALCVGRLGAKR